MSTSTWVVSSAFSGMAVVTPCPRAVTVAPLPAPRTSAPVLGTSNETEKDTQKLGKGKQPTIPPRIATAGLGGSVSSREEFHVFVRCAGFRDPAQAGPGAIEVRWRLARRDKSRSFTARALADSYRAELIRAARRGLEFDPATGEPAAWTAPKPTAISWFRHAVAYAEMKWPRLAPHSRASLADALATVTVLLTRPTVRRPADRVLRAALYGYAFNSQQRVLIANPAASALARDGARVAAGHQAKRSASHPGCPGRAVPPAGRPTRSSPHDPPKAGRVP